MPVTIRVQPTVRQPDGLAMSSRNAYLSPPQRQQALVLWKSLCLARELAEQGEREPGRIVERMREIILSVPEARIDYIALADPETLAPVSEIRGRTLAAVAVHVGGVRLIDNCLMFRVLGLGSWVHRSRPFDRTECKARRPKTKTRPKTQGIPVLQTLFYIPNQVGGIPVFGFGLLLAVWAVGSVLFLARLAYNKDSTTIRGDTCRCCCFWARPSGFSFRGWRSRRDCRFGDTA